MATPANINPRIIEGLYCEALVLSDEVRSSFAGSVVADGRARVDPDKGLEASTAFSCEALRTTTRMMHALAWLLNLRAYFNGELSEFQLRRYGRLADCPAGDPHRLVLLDQATRELVLATERFHARLRRIDRGWHEHGASVPSALARLRERLGVQPGG